jgi:type II secretory ATPase GspE/PulE/Tfp pilus assembly ATPase PilB-like protein
MLVAGGRIRSDQLEEALREQRHTRERLGQILGRNCGITAAELDRLSEQQSGERRLACVLQRFELKPRQIVQAARRIESKEAIEQVMRDTGYLSEEKVAAAMAMLHGMQYGGPQLVDEVDLRGLSLAGIGARHGQAFVPIAVSTGGTLVIALSSLDAQPAAHNSYHRCGNLQYLLASRSTVQSIFCRYFARVDEQLRGAIETAEEALRRLANGEDVDDAVNRRLLGVLLRFGCFSGASDLRFYSTLYRATINGRFDGVGKDVTEITRGLLDALWRLAANDAKIQSETVVDRLVEGALSFRDDEEMRAEFADVLGRYSFRLELGASAGGGRTAAIRILDSQSSNTALDQVGYEPHDLETIRRILREPEGLILLTGPTGSGKTTTLYSMLEAIDPEEKSVQTIENPVERRYGKWLQYEVGKGAADTEKDVFLDHFRQLLRNDPDVIMVGEIRSAEAARLTIQAAQTGHLVLSTLHVDRAHHVLGRFRGLGVDPGELADHLSLVVAQRLVRKLCRSCARPDASDDLKRSMASATNSWLEGEAVRAASPRAGGCANCNGTGYRGRTLVYELIEVDARVRGLIEAGVGALEIEQRLFADGRSLWDQGLRLVARGITSLAALRESVREPR